MGMESDVGELTKLSEEPLEDVEQGGVEQENVEGPDPSGSSLPIRDPFDPTNINIVTKNPVVDLIIKRIVRHEIDLNPDFQRHSDVWDRKRKSRLIESLLLCIPIPVFYMAADEEDTWQVVDGLQRLDTLKLFILDKRLRLRGLEYLNQFENHSYDDLPRPMQRRLHETELFCHVIQPGTPREVMFNVFKRINTGGKPLSLQEIRHALNPGRARDRINELATDQTFLEATTNSVSTKRMADRECVLRFIAFHLQPLNAYKGDLDAFLVKAMDSLNKDVSEEQWALLSADFRRAMRLATALFGAEAFRKPPKKRRSRRRDALADELGLVDERRSPINKPLFESWSVNLARLDESQGQHLIEQRETVQNCFLDLMGQDKFVESISIGTQWDEQVRTRFEEIETLLREVLQ